MRSGRIRKRFERTIPKPEVVIQAAAPQAPVSFDLVQPSRARERSVYEPSDEDNAIVERVSREFVDSFDLGGTVSFRHEDYQRIAIAVPENRAGALIGKRGATIDAIETLIGRMVTHQLRHVVPVQVDVNGYREEHEEGLRELARELAARVLETGEDEHLRPMNGRDRRVVHLEIEHLSGVETYSVGEGAAKHIVIHRERASQSE